MINVIIWKLSGIIPLEIPYETASAGKSQVPRMFSLKPWQEDVAGPMAEVQ